MNNVDEGVAAARAKLVAAYNGTPTEDGFVTPRGALNRWRGDTAIYDHAGWLPGHVASVVSLRVGHIIKSGFETWCGRTASRRSNKYAKPCTSCVRAASGEP